MKYIIATHNAHKLAEIARILGGIEVTELQRTAAREMIEEGRTL